MFKIIIKNLWKRKRQNAWLFAELLIVSILTWVILDPAIVSFYDIHKSPGYDIDRIVNVKIGSYAAGTKKYSEESATDEAKTADYNSIVAKAATLPDVELSGVVSMPLCDAGNTMIQNRIGNDAVDTLAKCQVFWNLRPGEKFFSLYGIETVDGSPSAKELESYPFRERDCIISETVDRAFWPDERGVNGKRFLAGRDESGQPRYMQVVAIVKDFKPRSYLRGSAAMFLPEMDNSTPDGFTVVLRLRDGVDNVDYISDNQRLINSTLRAGNYHVLSITDQRSDIDEVEIDYGVTSQRYFQITLAAFFLLSLILGVTGCVWLQTGKRVCEMGVLRSFGATRGSIVRMLTGEMILLATVAFAIGDVLYLQYALKEGLDIGYYQNDYYTTAPNWVDDFGQHFAIVSAIVYVIIIACVCVGTYFPARHVSRIEPVDALRDE